MSRDKLGRIGKNFDEELKKIKIERRQGVDQKYGKEVSNSRLTNKILEYPEWVIIKKKLIN
jgi:hypothetical protein